MGWKRTWFGSEDPTRKQVITTFVALGGCAAMLMGLFVDFVPAPALHGMHIAILFLILGVVAAAAFFSFASRQGTLRLVMGKGFLKPIAVFFGIPIVFSFVFWIIFARSMPWAFTKAFGEKYKERITLQTEYRRSRKTCDYRLRGDLIERSFPSYLCINEDFYRRHPNQMVSVVLVGKQSVFGISIQQILSDE
jgi:hypothetical protein